MDYTAILKRALQITWRRRALWLFGILLAFFGGGGGGGEGGSGSQVGQIIQYRLSRSDLWWIQRNWGWVLAIVLVLLAVTLVSAVISAVVRFFSTGALIGMVDEVERTETTSVAGGFRIGWARFLRLLAISLLLGVPATIVLLLLLGLALSPVLLVILAGRDAAALRVGELAILATVGFVLVWTLVAVAVSAVLQVLLEFMYRRSVLEGQGVIESIQEGYRMVRRNVRDAGLTWLLLFGIGLVVGVVSIPLVLGGLLLVAAPGVVVGLLSRSVIPGVLAALPFLLVFIGVVTFLQGLYLVFQSSVWTLVYRELAGQEGAAGQAGQGALGGRRAG